ncbi:hypothetical protein L2E82_13185 [Cichorium intybus]|uniref:Uncharacterized protein n=1 Tax=Cichorium intybus TaxID=13427 RepID=A0ACB9GI92_CICIN|nr:hypothetical protein L2E82_13185 [Cichorium intybus]
MPRISVDLAVQDETSDDRLGSKKRRRSDQTKIRLLQKAFLQIQDETKSKQLLFPHERGVVPCELLSELLQYATILEANNSCRDGFELRIGKQLEYLGLQSQA